MVCYNEMQDRMKRSTDLIHMKNHVQYNTAADGDLRLRPWWPAGAT